MEQTICPSTHLMFIAFCLQLESPPPSLKCSVTLQFIFLTGKPWKI